MSLRWLPQEEHLLRILRNKTDINGIAAEFAKRYINKASGFRSLRSADAIRRKCERDNITPESCKSYHKDDNSYTQRLDKMRKIQDKFGELSVAHHKGLVGKNNIARKIIAISDIHIPFARIDLLELILEEHKGADAIVINGDLLDGYVFSSYEKDKVIPALIEYTLAFELVELCSKLFKNVYLVEGNHDARVSRHLKALGFRNEHTDILRPNLLARIANGEKLDSTGQLIKKLDFKNVHFQERESWYIKLGKTIFAHPWSKGSSKPGFTVDRLNTFFRARYAEDEYDSIVCGHVHKIYKGVINSKLLIEQGCLAGLLAYSHSSRLAYMDNGMNGYAIIYQDKDGNTDYNWSGPIFLGEVLPPKKDALK